MRTLRASSDEVRTYRIGIDVGGTFTDLSIVCDQDSSVASWKVPSTPDDPSRGMLAGISESMGLLNAQEDEVTYLAHGTTVATNMLIERRGALTASITTRGFRDLLEIGRGQWPEMYHLDADKPQPLVRRSLCLEVPERILFDGTIEEPLDELAVEEIARALVKSNVAAVAVCFLHSYANPSHERRTREILERYAPGVSVSISSDVLPEYREYERAATTVANAYLLPRMARYLQALSARVRDAGIGVQPLISSSTGGLLPISTAAERPVLTVMSGPSAGLVGAIDVAKAAGFDNLITFDMGGTSTDVALVNDGRLPVVGTSKDIGGLNLAIPTADVVSIGAGGGSIAQIDSGGLLKVGPQSAGAVPGPACYGRGGTEATVTDAMMVLGYLNETSLLGGRMPMNRRAAEVAVCECVAAPLGLSIHDAALGILDVARSSIEQAISVVSVRRGHDPREFALLAFGGAGPQHATAVAQNLSISTVIVPPSPGTLCALGLLTSDMRTDYSRTTKFLAASESGAGLRDTFAELVAQATAWFTSADIPHERQVMRMTVDMRYVGQHHHIGIAIPAVPHDDEAWTRINDEFEAQHRRLYGHSAPGATEVVAARLAAFGVVDQPPAVAPIDSGSAPTHPPVAERELRFTRGEETRRTAIYQREHLRPGDILEGPVVVEQMDTTTVIFPGQTASVDRWMNIIVSIPRLGSAAA